MIRCTHIDEINCEIKSTLDPGCSPLQTLMNKVNRNKYSSNTFFVACQELAVTFLTLVGWNYLRKAMTTGHLTIRSKQKISNNAIGYTHLNPIEPIITIYISADYYNLENDEMRKDLICTIIHELIHLVFKCHLIAGNDHENHCDMFKELCHRVGEQFGLSANDLR